MSLSEHLLHGSYNHDAIVLLTVTTNLLTYELQRSLLVVDRASQIESNHKRAAWPHTQIESLHAERAECLTRY